MTLEKRAISLPFTQGPDTKTDKLLSAKPSRVENMLTVGGTLQKRYGTKQLTATTDTGSTLTKGEALFEYGNELVRINGGSLYELGGAYNRWVTRAARHFGTNGITRIQRSGRISGAGDHAVVGTYAVSAWSESSGTGAGLHISVRDESTGTVILDGSTVIDAGGVQPRCVTLGTKVLIVFKNVVAAAGSVSCIAFDSSSPETIPASIQLRNDYNGAGHQDIDVAVYGNTAYVCYPPTGDKTITVFGINGAGSITQAAVTLAATATNTITALAMAVSSSGSLFFVAAESVGPFFWYTAVSASSFATVVKAKTTIGTPSAGVNNFCVSIGETTTSGNMFVFHYTLGAIGTAVINSSGVSTAYAETAGLVGTVPATRPFTLDGATCFGVIVGGSTKLQNSLFIVDTSFNVVARCLFGVSYWTPLLSDARLSSAVTLPSGAIAILAPERQRTAYSSFSGVVFDVTSPGLTRVELKVGSALGLPVNRVGESVYIGGANPSVYDGAHLVETGFNLFAESGGTVTFAGAAGSLSTGTYQWRYLYSWTNARGELVRSAPSPAVSGTAAANQTATLTINNLPLTAKSTVVIEVYRTEANGTTFYRASSATSPTYTGGANTITITDGISDAALVAGELLYTTGGVNDNIAPPSYSIACEHRGRLVIAGLEDRYAWRSSSTYAVGEQLRFNEDWGGRVPEETGEITGVASMDGNLVIFTAQTAYLAAGDGPDLLGNNNWEAPQLITSVNEGAVAGSVIAAADGILFKTSRGIKHLSRGFQCEYIGADVEAYNGLTIRCATLRPEIEQVWFHCDGGSDVAGAGSYLYGTWYTQDGGVVLAYDYHYGQWQVLTDYGAQASCYYQGQYTRVRGDGVVFQEVPYTWTDSASHYSTVVETGWLKLAGLQGFQRLWRAELLGQYGSPCTITWDAAYNYDPTYSAQDTTVTSIGTQSAGTAVQLRRHLRVQKCEAVKFRFTITTNTGTGQGIGLTDLTLEVGGKKGAFKLPAAKSL